MSRLLIILTCVAASLACHVVQLSGSTSTSSQSPHTTKLHFPEPWAEAEQPDRPLSTVQQIEVRKIPNSSADEFFFVALPYGDNDYSNELYRDIPPPKYSHNAYVVSLTEGPKIRAATRQEWQSASRMWIKPRMLGYSGNDDSTGEIEYRGKKYPKTGKYWGSGWLSPSGKWLATFSYTAVKPPPNLFFGSSPRSGDIFWEVYDTVTGEKVFDWQARNVKQPTSLDGPVMWLEDRYFLFPEDEDAQNFIVLTLPAFTPEPNPVTVQLPSRFDDKGQRRPAAVRNEAWTPLVPLTKEQAARITAPSPTELFEVRLSAQSTPRELLLAIKEETENSGHNRASGDGAGDYNLRVFSTYYYALSLDDLTQSRFASKEEWERGRVLRSSSHKISLDETIDTFGGKRRAYRPFPKTGASWASPMALSAGEWIPVFSYTQETGKLFVDIFERRSGNKAISTELPYTGSANALFAASVWIEEGYLILPLDPAINSFVFWKLPGGIA